MTSTHTLGSSGYANKKEEMKESRPDKSEPTEAEVYVAAHVHRDGTPLTAKVTEVIEKIADGTGGDDPLTLVLGENKCKYRPRTFGLAPAWGVRNSRKSIIKTTLEVQRNADEKVVKVQEDMKQTEARHQDEMNQMKAEQVRIFTILEKMNPNALLNSTSDLNTLPNVAGDEPSLDHTRHVDDEGIHNDDSSTQDAYNLGVGSFGSMLQSPPRRVDITPRNVPNRNASRTDSPLHLSPSVPNALSIGRSMEMSDVGGVRISEGLTYVLLKSLRSPGVDVARAGVCSKDPKKLVGGEELGVGFVEVFIIVPIKRDEPLIRPYGSYQFIGDVVAQSIAWPSSFVEPV